LPCAEEARRCRRQRVGRAALLLGRADEAARAAGGAARAIDCRSLLWHDVDRLGALARRPRIGRGQICAGIRRAGGVVVGAGGEEHRPREEGRNSKMPHGGTSVSVAAWPPQGICGPLRAYRLFLLAPARQTFLGESPFHLALVGSARFTSSPGGPPGRGRPVPGAEAIAPAPASRGR